MLLSPHSIATVAGPSFGQRLPAPPSILATFVPRQPSTPAQDRLLLGLRGALSLLYDSTCYLLHTLGLIVRGARRTQRHRLSSQSVPVLRTRKVLIRRGSRRSFVRSGRESGMRTCHSTSSVWSRRSRETTESRRYESKGRRWGRTRLCNHNGHYLGEKFDQPLLCTLYF